MSTCSQKFCLFLLRRQLLADGYRMLCGTRDDSEPPSAPRATGHVGRLRDVNSCNCVWIHEDDQVQCKILAMSIALNFHGSGGTAMR